MKQFGVMLLGLCVLGAAGCSDDSTNPSNLPIVMTASLSPANEVPAIANAENTGGGAVQITLNVTRDGTGAITGGTAEFHFQLSGFPSSTSIVAAHIHPGAAGVNGGVIVNTGVVAAISSDTVGRGNDLYLGPRLGTGGYAPEHREQSCRLLLQRALADEPRRRGARTIEPRPVGR